ncbi:MAG TPA: TIM barrel protein [Anaerolineales bacterium]|jgi:deoxyribonuclease-4|nr:TIM barrel protein [Anaerolineales bacterium]
MTESDFQFGTVGSPISTPKKPGGSAGAVAHSADLGLSTLELGWVHSVRVKETTCEKINMAAAEHRVALSVHAPYFINLNAKDDEWPKSRKRLMDAAHYGNLAGATDIIFHPGSYFGSPAADVLPLALQRLRACVQELRAAGNPVTLRPETMGKSAMLGSLEDTLQLAQEIPGVAPCIDIAHLHARPGDGSVNTYAEFDAVIKSIGTALGEQALRQLHIHISGIDYGPKGEKRHLPFEDADLRYRDFLRALADNACAGRLLCESPIMEEDALLIKSAWNKIQTEGQRDN